MVPQMNNKTNDRNVDACERRRAQLIEHCIELGMPVTGDEDEETLEMYIHLADDDDFDDMDFDDNVLGKDNMEKNSSESKKLNMLSRLMSLFM